MRIALAQLNPTVGALRENMELVRRAAKESRRNGADLLIASELVISGYPPKDLLLREGFADACDRTVEELAGSIDPQMGLIVGHPSRWNLPHGRVANAASLLHGGRVEATVGKTLLPNYDVFDERRYFRPAEAVTPVFFGGRRLGLHICEDAWWGEPNTFYHTDPGTMRNPIDELAAEGAEVLINISASPFESAKPGRRRDILRRHVAHHRLPFLLVNQVGGNDDLVFDGHSLVLNAAGETALQAAGFASDLKFCELDNLPRLPPAGEASREGQLLEALVLGVRDYLHKCGFTDCVLGLSGGIDSSLTASIAAQAVGPEHVHGLIMPSRFSSEHSVADARQLADNLGIDVAEIPIDPIHKAYEATPVLGEDLTSQPGGVANQNVQARIRGAIVMTRSNRHGWLALATGNKSELAVGYCTLYGDMAGGFAVLSDVLKRDVYAMARSINAVSEKREIIPERILSKPPSAELAPDQFDADSLPSYSVLDSILEGLVEGEMSVASLSRRFPEQTVRWIADRLDRNEFKRRQMPPGIKLSARAFGSGRRMPIAARFHQGR